MVAKEYSEVLNASGTEISVISTGTDDDYLSLTDIAKKKNEDAPADVVKNWLRSGSTIEFLGLWERINNPEFKLVEFDQFRNESGTNAFTMSPQKWITATKAIGIKSKSGRYGGTYAHKDIAFEFASWISPEFKLYVIQDYQRLKFDENSRISNDWNLRRSLSSINYRIHTDAIKDCLIDEELPQKYQGYKYADEADMLNIAVFGMTAKDWRDSNGDTSGNIRDYATIEQLIILSNLEGINANLVRDGIPIDGRLVKLRKIASSQMLSLLNNKTVKKLKGKQ